MIKNLAPKKIIPMMIWLTLGVTSSSVAFANNDTILRVCADPGNMPISNDKGEGFSNKIAKVIAESMGKSVTYFYRPYLNRGLTRQTFDNNECDILMDMTPDDERMLTTKPLYMQATTMAKIRYQRTTPVLCLLQH